MPKLSEIRKALVALAVPLLVGFAARIGLDLEPPTVAALTTVLTALAVYLIPNDTGQE